MRITTHLERLTEMENLKNQDSSVIVLIFLPVRIGRVRAGTGLLVKLVSHFIYFGGVILF